MVEMRGEIEKGIKILEICEHISKNCEIFSGLGFVIATHYFLKRYTLPLRPSREHKLIDTFNSKYSGSIKHVSEFLISLSTSKSFSDGFSILDKNLNFIGICRMLLIKKTRIRPNEERGTRFYVAKIVSSYKGAKFVGIIESDKKAFYFVNGNTYSL